MYYHYSNSVCICFINFSDDRHAPPAAKRTKKKDEEEEKEVSNKHINYQIKLVMYLDLCYLRV